MGRDWMDGIVVEVEIQVVVMKMVEIQTVAIKWFKF